MKNLASVTSNSHLDDKIHQSYFSYNISFREKMKKLWNNEYKIQPTIPSSHRCSPAHALLEISNKIDFKELKVLDMGCGNGRNSIYMAEQGAHVTAIDFSSVAINILNSSISLAKNTPSINTINKDICNGLPFEDKSVDLILDSYCLCHFIDIESTKRAMQDCLRVLKTKGRLIKIHLSNEDQYYLDRQESNTAYGHISLDSANNLRKNHFSLNTYLDNVTQGFNLLSSKNICFNDIVRGKNYKRNIFVCVLEKI